MWCFPKSAIIDSQEPVISTPALYSVDPSFDFKTGHLLSCLFLFRGFS
jgi:hypothetical protein